MIGLIYHYDDRGMEVFSHNLWQNTLCGYGVTPFCVDISTEPKFSESAQRYRSLIEIQMMLPDLEYVYLIPEMKIPGSPIFSGPPTDRVLPYKFLHEFQHPIDDVMYVIGADSTGLDIQNLDLSGRNSIVSLQTNGLWQFWSFPVAVMVIYDRWLKWQLQQ